MANGHGGARPGSGAKRKPLAEKLLLGNPGRKKLEHLDFGEELKGQDMPEPKEYLAAKQRDGTPLKAREIYIEMWNWLNDRDCAELVNTQLLESYAMAAARWLQCEEAIDNFGFLSKHPTTGAACQSPFVAMGQSYRKQMLNIWFQIYQIVRENCFTEFGRQSLKDDPMEQLLSGRWRTQKS
jgi:hypothetical protein